MLPNKLLFALVRYCTLSMGGGGGSSYDGPTLAQIERQMNLGDEALDFSKQIYYEGKPRQARLDKAADEVAAANLDTLRANNAYAEEQRARSRDVFNPLEDALAEEAGKAGSAEMQDQAAGTAAAGYRSATAATEDMAARRAAGLGLKYRPANSSVASAAQLAGITNAARTAEKGRGLALKSSVANMGRGLAADTNAGYGLGLSAGNSAVGTLSNASAVNAGQANGVMAGYNTAIGTAQAGASGFGQMGARQISADSARDASTASLVGTAAGLMVASDRRAKTDIEHLGTYPNGLGQYAFSYRQPYIDGAGPGRFIGVMAHEVEKIRPDCVITGEDGFQRVDYDRLGIVMERIAA